MKILITLSALLSFITIPDALSVDKKEIKAFCRKTMNYNKCIKEFEGYENATTIRDYKKPIKLDVIPYKY